MIRCDVMLFVNRKFSSSVFDELNEMDEDLNQVLSVYVLFSFTFRVAYCVVRI